VAAARDACALPPLSVPSLAGAGKTTALYVLVTALASLKQQQRVRDGADAAAAGWKDVSLCTLSPAAAGRSALLGGHVDKMVAVPEAAGLPVALLAEYGGDAAAAAVATAAAGSGDVEWVDGVFIRRVRQLVAAERVASGGGSALSEAGAAPATNLHWLVLDGPLSDAPWEEGIYGAMG